MNDINRIITVCPACGAAAWGRPNFCPGCGASVRTAGQIELPEEDETCGICHVCGATVPVSAGFCPNCGADLRYPARFAREEGEAESEKAAESETEMDEVYGPPDLFDPIENTVSGGPVFPGRREHTAQMTRTASVYAPPELMGKRGASGPTEPERGRGLFRKKKDK